MSQCMAVSKPTFTCHQMSQHGSFRCIDYKDLFSHALVVSNALVCYSCSLVDIPDDINLLEYELNI